VLDSGLQTLYATDGREEMPMTDRVHPRFAAPLAAAAVLLLLAGCSTLGVLAAAVRPPEVRVAAVEITAVSFEGLTLRFDLELTNPNGVGIQLAGLDYDLQIDGSSFLKGETTQALTIAARERSVLPLPLELRFEELFRSLGSLADREESSYRLEAGLSFQLPVLDRVRVPVRREGTIPVIRLPRLAVQSLRLRSLSLQRASLTLGLQIDNPNGFLLSLEALEYRFRVAGQDWASGATRGAARVAGRGTGALELPLELDFAAVGQSVYRVLVGSAPLGYAFSGSVRFATSLPLLPSATIPVNLEGQVRLLR
jgi:LEA14-like dessication related protein